MVSQIAMLLTSFTFHHQVLLTISNPACWALPQTPTWTNTLQLTRSPSSHLTSLKLTTTKGSPRLLPRRKPSSLQKLKTAHTMSLRKSHRWDTWCCGTLGNPAVVPVCGLDCSIEIWLVLCIKCKLNNKQYLNISICFLALCISMRLSQYTLYKTLGLIQPKFVYF